MAYPAGLGSPTPSPLHAVAEARDWAESLEGSLARRGFTVIKRLGSGAYGTALLVRHDPAADMTGGGGGDSSFARAEGEADGELYVVKTIDLRGMRPRDREAALGEVAVLRQLRHPNIVDYHGSWLTPDDQLCIVLEVSRCVHHRRHAPHRRRLWRASTTAPLIHC
jgi:serine/threonine protein kinase